MYQAATQVKLSRPEIIIVVQAEALHYDRRQNTSYRYGEITGAHRALRVWQDTRRELRELGRTVSSSPRATGGVEYAGTSRKMRTGRRLDGSRTGP